MKLNAGNQLILNKQKDDDNISTGLGADAIAESMIENLYYLQAEMPEYATGNDWYMALAYTVRDRKWLVRRGRNPKED